MNYIDNKRFEKLILLYTQGDITVEEELIDNFTLLINNIISSFHFSKIDPEDARQECFILILKTLKNFKPSNGSAFNYFTTIIVNNLRLIYSKNKKYEEKINRYTNKILGIHEHETSGSPY